MQAAWLYFEGTGVMSTILLSTIDNNKLSSVINGTSLLRFPPLMVLFRQMTANLLRQMCAYCTAVSCAVAAAVGSQNAPQSDGVTRRRRRTMTEVETTRRLGLSLGVAVFNEFSQLARERKSTLAQVVRLALGLGRVVIAESKKGNRLLVVSPEGTALKQLMLPGI
jgi:hypothetical protein